MNWPLVKLGDLCVVKRGTTITQKEAIEGKVPVVGGGLKPTYFHNSSNRNGNTITVSGSGASAGFINFYKEPIFASDCSTVEPKNDTVDVSYIYRAMQNLQEYIYTKLKAGAAQPHVYAKDLANLEIPFPPLAEQQRIAGLLDTADLILKQRESAMAKLDQLAQSVFVDMFGDPLANSKNFETVKVSGICKLINGRAFKPTEWKESGKPIIRIQNLNDETKPFNYTQVNYDEKYLIKNGDTLFSWSGTPGTSFGCFKWLREDGWLNQHIFKVILNEKLITADFFIMKMNLKIGELISQAHGGVGLQHVTKKMVDQLPLILPPMKLQLDFCKRVTEFEKIKHIYKNAFDSTNLLQSSLQHQSFAVN